MGFYFGLYDGCKIIGNIIDAHIVKNAKTAATDMCINEPIVNAIGTVMIIMPIEIKRDSIALERTLGRDSNNWPHFVHRHSGFTFLKLSKSIVSPIDTAFILPNKRVLHRGHRAMRLRYF